MMTTTIIIVHHSAGDRNHGENYSIASKSSCSRDKRNNDEDNDEG